VKRSDEIELIPDSWERFERAADTVSKSGPQRRSGNQPIGGMVGSLSSVRDGSEVDRTTVGQYAGESRMLPDFRLVQLGSSEYFPKSFLVYPDLCNVSCNGRGDIFSLRVMSR
jgi:hypothetical protein